MREILIKGMEMPKHLHECPMRTNCPLVMDGCFLIKDGEKRHNDCPLVEVPPHGRLIDADNSFDGVYYDMDELWYAIDSAPTIIEASR